MNTTTTELLPLAEAMSARDLGAHGRALCKVLGGEGEVYVSVSQGKAHVSIYPSGLCVSRDAHYISCENWPDALSEASAWISARPIITRETRVRKMALTIIDIKDELGRVTAPDLERRGFTHDEVRDLHADACVRAGELCQGAPFIVEGV